ncbi:tRNA pseudouridine(55) synthase TruB [Wenzhouxiangella sp. XN79A]|uniref:tRNA pseudouridine(55) synthase TruB n=1 Tax=Wenzhouxiangella sp. XN79A TaxID=2724193 RepID=UPI00144A73E9|nr:tRNA pseudouridine(55) synthase TruB [Wenzhouxiangella sp. XN79A]NKI33802.1 tRNA pseudouridine(55) synthase TruB [Wenzhouxiangella sp. XN79A]
MSRSGILLLDKPPGLTSNQALGRAKRLLGLRKAGHTGALDPMATGLLPLCFGEATKVSAFLLDADKRYLAELELGVSTDSGDADGKVIATAEVPPLDREGLDRLLDRFRGPIEQVPPMVSALKHEGRRLHELARAGIEVERPPRPVIIHELDLLAVDGARLALRVDCSKGTYIRSLAMDIGAALGCGAHLTALRRERSGPFALADAVTLETLEDDGEEAARARMMPPDRALPGLPSVDIDADAAARIRQGQAVRCTAPPGDPVRMYSEGIFLGLGRIDERQTLGPRRLIHPE